MHVYMYTYIYIYIYIYIRIHKRQAGDAATAILELVALPDGGVRRHDRGVGLKGDMVVHGALDGAHHRLRAHGRLV